MSINYGSILDTRDLEKRIGELEALEQEINDTQDAVDAKDGDPDELQDALDDALAAFNNEQEWDKELEELQSAREEVCDWIHGEALISRSKWSEYCRYLVKDIGDIPKGLPAYIADNINWDGVADDLEDDYASLTLNREEYLYLSY